MTFNFKKALAYIYILYAATTIFMPKIKIGDLPSGIYPFEVICTVLSFSLLLLGKLRFTPLEKNYFGYVFMGFFSWLLWELRSDSINIVGLLKLIKYTSFILLIPIAFYLKPFLSESTIRKILYSQVLFVIVAGSYTAYHTFINPMPVNIMMGQYSPEYRMIGLIGKALTPQGLVHIGTASVQIGVYMAILSLISLSLYFRIKEQKYLAISFIFFCGLLLAYSRSGFMVMVIGIIYFLVLKFLNKRVFKFTMALVVSVFLLSLFTDFWSFVSSWGIMGKLSQRGFEDVGRMRYWQLGWDYILTNPLDLFFGTGYGSVELVIRIGTLESLFFDTFFETGIFGLLFLLIAFYYLWNYSRNYSKPYHSESYLKAVLFGYQLAIPGWFFANTVGGNSLQSDFMAPALFLILGICLAHTGHFNKRVVSETE